MVEDFEDYAAGEAPFNWKILNRNTRSVESLDPDFVRDQDYFEAVLHGNNTVLRAYTRNETVQIARLNGDGYEWDLQTHPALSWRWRATVLPEGAREDRRGSTTPEPPCMSCSTAKTARAPVQHKVHVQQHACDRNHGPVWSSACPGGLKPECRDRRMDPA